MSYTKTDWENLPSTDTPIVANSLNNIENGIKQNDTILGVEAYDSTATYEKGDYCVYNNVLQRANQDISTAEAFTQAHWDTTSVEEELDALRKSGGIPTNSVIGYDGSTIPSGFEEIQNYEASYELTNLPSQSVGTNSYSLTKIGKVVYFNCNVLWRNSLSANTWTDWGQIPSAIYPNINTFCPGIILSGDTGNVIGTASVRINTSGTIAVKSTASYSGSYVVGVIFNMTWVLS